MFGGDLKTILAIELLNSIYALNFQPSCQGKSSSTINKFLKKIIKKDLITVHNVDGHIPALDIDCLRDFIEKFDILGFLNIRK